MIRWMTRWVARGAFLLMLVVAAAVVVQLTTVGRADIPTYSSRALPQALKAAAVDAAEALFTQLPADVETIAILPFPDEPVDADAPGELVGGGGRAWHDVNTAFVAIAGERLHVVTRLEEEWALLDGEELFTERNADQMTELPGFEEKYPATAIAWGRVRECGTSDDGAGAYARIELRAGMPSTWRIVSVTGVGQVEVDPPTIMSGFVMPLVRDPRMWMATAGALVLGVALLILSTPIRRRIGFATAPRQLVR